MTYEERDRAVVEEVGRLIVGAEMRIMAELELNRGSAQGYIAEAERHLQDRLNGLMKALSDTLVGSVSNVIRRLEKTPTSIEEALAKATHEQLLDELRNRDDAVEITWGDWLEHPEYDPARACRLAYW